MKKQKMLMTLAGLVVAVATTATIAAYTLAGDGSSPPVGESAGTQEPGFQDDKLPAFDPAYNTIYDGKGSVSSGNTTRELQSLASWRSNTNRSGTPSLTRMTSGE